MTTFSADGRTASAITLTHLGGPSVLIELVGARLLVDPTFDPPGDYPVGARSLRKTEDAVWSPTRVGEVDAVLLSHDQHPDNLDRAGRAYVATAPVTFTTVIAAERLAGTATALQPWTSERIGPVTVTAVPAQHGPDGTEHLTGPVTGFVLTAEDQPTVYVSGDNASLRVVEEVAARFHVDVAVLNAGAARTPLVNGYLTLTSVEAVTATEILGRPSVLPVHTDGWAHFTEPGATLRAAFAKVGVEHLLLPARPGEPVPVPARS